MFFYNQKREILEYENIKEFFSYNLIHKKETLQILCKKICDEIILKGIFSVLTSKERQVMMILRLEQIFIDFYMVERDYNFFESVASHVEEHNVLIKDNGFIAFPWCRNSLLWMFEKFRAESFQWEQDVNHSITLVKPFNIYFVNNGNHSIACGKFFNKDGKISCNSAIDYTNILQEYHYDGEYFVDKKGKRKNKPFYKEFVNLFFLGKIMLEVN
jgi:hypothetical protein